VSSADHRERLGRRVREVWIAWAERQPDPKPSWLVPYDELSEADKEADRCIGVALWGDGFADGLAYVQTLQSLPSVTFLETHPELLGPATRAEGEEGPTRMARRDWIANKLPFMGRFWLWWERWRSTYHGAVYHRFGADRCTYPWCLRRSVQDLRCYEHRFGAQGEEGSTPDERG